METSCCRKAVFGIPWSTRVGRNNLGRRHAERVVHELSSRVAQTSCGFHTWNYLRVSVSPELSRRCLNLPANQALRFDEKRSVAPEDVPLTCGPPSGSACP